MLSPTSARSTARRSNRQRTGSRTPKPCSTFYRVASSLDSMVVGESQILGQVREAYRAATEEQCTGQVLNRLFHTSLRVGKRVRTETGIGDSSISVPHVAVKLAEEVFGTLAGRRALVLGAGEMSELVLKHLKAKGVGELRIANRTTERARLLAERVGGHPVEFSDLAAELREVDVVVSSTGSGDWVVDHNLVQGVLEGRREPLFFVDIAVPRDVDPAVQALDRAYVYDVDDLQSVVEHNIGDRGEAARKGGSLDRAGCLRVHELAEHPPRGAPDPGTPRWCRQDPAPRTLPRP